MFANYLKIAFRNLARHKGYSFINIIGLSVGILSCLLIMLYVRYENSFDSFHPNADRICRITELQSFPGKEIQHVAVTAGLMASTMAGIYPEIEAVTRLEQWNHFLVKSGDETLYLENVVYADSGFFSFFGFPLIKGDPASALREPFSMVVTASTARTLFGGDDPLGKVVNGDYDIPYTIRGVAQDPAQLIEPDFAGHEGDNVCRLVHDGQRYEVSGFGKRVGMAVTLHLFSGFQPGSCCAVWPVVGSTPR